MATPLIIPKAYFWDPQTGLPLALGKVYSYEAGTSAHKPTYTDPSGTIPNTQPITLNGAGYADIYLAGKYKLMVYAADGRLIWTADNVSDVAHIYEEWVYPTEAIYVSAVQFKVVGSMTDVFVSGRNLKLSDAVTIYASVTASYYSAGYTYVTISATQPITANLTYVSVSGATTATRLAVPRNINGVPFDGTADVTVPVSSSDMTSILAAINSAVAALVASSPAALDTLNELAAALGNDANFATTITNALIQKADEARLGGYRSSSYFSGETVSLSMSYIGEYCFLTSTGNQSTTLPDCAGNDGVMGMAIVIGKTQVTGTATIHGYGSTQIDYGIGSGGSVVLRGGEFAVFVWTGTCWRVSGTIQYKYAFQSTLSTYVVKKYPDPNSSTGYFKELWMKGPASTGENMSISVTFAEGFTTCRFVEVTTQGAGADRMYQLDSFTNTGCIVASNLFNSATGTQYPIIHAIGE
jgi:hypothetical protein